MTKWLRSAKNKETFLNELIETHQDLNEDEMKRTIDTEGMVENGVIAAVPK
jgi:hypothetical protein